MSLESSIMHIAKLIARDNSRDPSTKVGAVIANGWELIGWGYNKLVHGAGDYSEHETREYKLDHTIHAEMDALIFMDRSKMTADTTMYVTMFPCIRCATHIVAAGIRKVVSFDIPPGDDPKLNEWRESAKKSKKLFDSAGVEVQYLERSEFFGEG